MMIRIWLKLIKIKKSTELSNVGDREYFYKQLDELLTKSGFFYSSEMAPVVKRNIEVYLIEPH